MPCLGKRRGGLSALQSSQTGSDARRGRNDAGDAAGPDAANRGLHAGGVADAGDVEALPARRMVKVHTFAGSAETFHNRHPVFGAEIEIVVCEVERPALVLGSRQDAQILDLARSKAQGWEVVRRRSGGTLVHLIPGEVLWVDLLLGASHPAFTSDLRASMMWMGAQWAAVLEEIRGPLPSQSTRPGAKLSSVGPPADIKVFDGAVERSAWADLLCFGGLGPGEVMVGNAKLVGVSQRRTRLGAWFQMAIHRRFEVTDLSELWAVETPPTTDLRPVATLDHIAEISNDELLERLAHQVSS
jgi:lipoate---protein ligase